MLFNSIQFAVFFPVVTFLYYLTPHRARWLLLLIASCVFYMAFVPRYIWILAFTIAIDYVAGLLIARSTGATRRAWLMVSLAANIGILCYYKYFNFIVENVRALAAPLHVGWQPDFLHVVLPIGLSFHIFQSLSYTIEVYRGAQAPERHLGIYALYVMFYPQLVAGPIERPQNLLHQFHAPHPFRYENLTRGIQRMVWGLWKKVVIADRLSPMVSRVFDHPHEHTGVPAIVATLAFTFQIYCDFSGYSDIALGSAETMGITLLENFQRPYSSKSIGEFWTRWHVSLSHWFRDYVYIPLGGNRRGTAARIRNLVVVFLISGLWHGARWTFVMWGALHALYLLAEMALRRIVPMASGGAAWVRVQNALVFAAVAFAWIFFRATSISDGLYVAAHLTTGLRDAVGHPSVLLSGVLAVSPSRRELIVAVTAVVIMHIVERADAKHDLRDALARSPIWTRWSIFYAVLLSVVLLGVYSNESFIYFQF